MQLHWDDSSIMLSTFLTLFSVSPLLYLPVSTPKSYSHSSSHDYSFLTISLSASNTTTHRTYGEQTNCAWELSWHPNIYHPSGCWYVVHVFYRSHILFWNRRCTKFYFSMQSAENFSWTHERTWLGLYIVASIMSVLHATSGICSLLPSMNPHCSPTMSTISTFYPPFSPVSVVQERFNASTLTFWLSYVYPGDDSSRLHV